MDKDERQAEILALVFPAPGGYSLFMVTKREYLIQKGLARQGQGRFSNAAKEELKKAINKGVKFDELGTNVVSGVEQTKDPRPTRPEGIYTFTNPDGRQFKRSHTTACVECGYSFRWCYCVSGPHVWAYLSGRDERATLQSVPRATKVTPAAPRRKGRKAAA